MLPRPLYKWLNPVETSTLPHPTTQILLAHIKRKEQCSFSRLNFKLKSLAVASLSYRGGPHDITWSQHSLRAVQSTMLLNRVRSVLDGDNKNTCRWTKQATAAFRKHASLIDNTSALLGTYSDVKLYIFMTKLQSGMNDMWSCLVFVLGKKTWWSPNCKCNVYDLLIHYRTWMLQHVVESKIRQKFVFFLFTVYSCK